MVKRNLSLLPLSLIGLLLIIKPINIQGIDLSLTDPINDLIYKVDGITVAYNITAQPEIDIISLELNNTFVAVTFLATPVLSIDNWYDFIIYWNGQDVQNWTDGHWNEGNIISQTKLVNSTGGIIVNTQSNSSIEVIGNTIYYTILNSSLIVTDLDPVNMIMDARHRTGPGAEYYQDTLEYNIGTTNMPGFTFVKAFLGITLVSVTFIFNKKKR